LAQNGEVVDNLQKKFLDLAKSSSWAWIPNRSSPASRPSEQALALMDHPNIAKVLDAGATETGPPCFVIIP
jgi:hypothetical protein